ncbi:hypothetical protein [uncultured Psychrobacter sp.]|uniref:hypothetical protein n=1 Tax=uncultured Psychrobacter sp. TaxID=259303 RepID=UPI00345A54FA
MSINDTANRVDINNKKSQISTCQLSTWKKGLFITLTAVALTLSACSSQEEEKPMESSVHEFDAQTSEEEAAAEIAAANAPMISDREDNPISPSRDEPEGSGAVIGAQATPDTDVTGGVGSTVNTDMPDNTVGTDLEADNDLDTLNDSDMIEETSVN